MQTLRNIATVRVFLMTNIVIFIIALLRMHLTASSPQQPIAIQRPSSSRSVQGFHENTCDHASYQAKINTLKSQINNLTGSLSIAKENEKRLTSEVEHTKQAGNIGVASISANTMKKTGDDFHSDQEFQVPNIVHYIWYNTEPAPFEFHHMLSVLSVHKFIKPDIIYFHTDTPPIGKYWDRIQSLPELKINKRKPPYEAFNEKIKEPVYYTSHSNVDRVLVLMEYGGIYLDFDFMAVNSFDDLRRHVCTIGLESDEKACGSVIVCSKDAFFLYLWINAYFDDYRIDEWAYNTGQVPFNFAKRYPHLVNAERTKLNRPNFAELGEIWGPKPTWWKWRENYGFHSWYRLYKSNYGGEWYEGVEPDEENVKTGNNAFAEIARVILYDTPDVIT